MLFRAGIDPRTPIGRLDTDQRDRLFRAFNATMRTLGRRGGSHTGDHMESRFPGAYCPLDGAPMLSGDHRRTHHLLVLPAPELTLRGPLSARDDFGKNGTMQSFIQHYGYYATLLPSILSSACIPIPTEIVYGFAGRTDAPRPSPAKCGSRC